MNKILTIVSIIALCSTIITGVVIMRTVKVDMSVGALAGPDIPYNYFGFGGVREYAGKTDSLYQASTTVCAIQSPAATSTLTFGSINLTVSSTTASTVIIAKSATAYATTTRLGQGPIAASAQGTVLATTTISIGTDDVIVFAPSQWFVVSMQTPAGVANNIGTFSPTGICEAVWKQN